jgi:hypothetical protein
VQSFALAPRGGFFDEGTPPQLQNLVSTEAGRRNGEFELRGILPGLYDLFPIANVILNGEQRYGSGRVPVEVRSGDVDGVLVVVNPGIDLMGEIHVVGNRSVVKTEDLHVSLRALDDIPSPFSARIRPKPVNASGGFTIRNVPEAVYALVVSPMPSGAYVSDIRIGKTSVLDSGIVVGKTPLGPIVVTLDTEGRTVEGFAYRENQKPAANAVVVLVPPPGRRQNTNLYSSANCEADGHFKITGVAPGEYKVFAWEKVLSTAWENAEFLAKFEKQGRELSVKNKDISGMKVQAIGN